MLLRIILIYLLDILTFLLVCLIFYLIVNTAPTPTHDGLNLDVLAEKYCIIKEISSLLKLEKKLKKCQ